MCFPSTSHAPIWNRPGRLLSGLSPGCAPGEGYLGGEVLLKTASAELTASLPWKPLAGGWRGTWIPEFCPHIYRHLSLSGLSKGGLLMAAVS